MDMNDGRGGSNEKTSSGTEIAIEIENDANVLDGGKGHVRCEVIFEIGFLGGCAKD